MRVDDTCRAWGHHRLRGLRSCLSQDIGRYLTMSPENIARGNTFKRRLSAFLRPELQSLLLHRISHYLHVNRWHRLAVMVSRFNGLLHRVTISPQSCIGPGCRMPHPAIVSFHGRAGRGLTVYAEAVCCAEGAMVSGPLELAPQLGDDVVVGAQAVVIGRISVGNHARIGFNVRLDRDAPDHALVVSRASRTVLRQEIESSGRGAHAP